MRNILSEYYGTPLIPRVAYPSEGFKNGAGFFRFGPNLVCYGECSRGVANDISNSEAFDVSKAITIANSELHLPFDIGNVIENLRRERYFRKLSGGTKGGTQRGWIRRCYYSVRELLPIWFRRYLQRAYLKDWRTLQFPHWPVDFTVDSLHESLMRMTMIAQGRDRVPFIWLWPDGAPSCLMLTNDVETADELFFCGTAVEITPIKECDGRVIGDGGRPGPVTRKLQETFFAAVHGKLPQYRSWLSFSAPIRAAEPMARREPATV